MRDPRRRVRRSLLRAAALGTLLLGAASAGADAHDEREARLKGAGVDDELRPRIHAAIEDGARWLAARVDGEGSLRAGEGGVRYHETGRTALAALALAHAGTPDAEAAARRAARRLFVTDKSARAALRSETYTAGLGGLLAAEPACDVAPEDARTLAEALAYAQQPSTGWWGYGLTRFSPGRPSRRPGLVREANGQRRVVTGTESPGANLSTTQFAVLGLWGLSRRGVPVLDAVWRTHLEHLCRLQADDGSWPYSPVERGSGYPNGTFMGLAGLLVAESALSKRDLDVDLRRAVAVARLKGVQALRRDVSQWFAQHGAAGAPRAAALDYYGLYALEKACVFADLERIGGESWYARGARVLLAAQDRDGGWGRTRAQAGAFTEREIATSFAILFLTRSAERYRPTTPREAPVPATRPGATITPRDAPASPRAVR